MPKALGGPDELTPQASDPACWSPADRASSQHMAHAANAPWQVSFEPAELLQRAESAIPGLLDSLGLEPGSRRSVATGQKYVPRDEWINHDGRRWSHR